MLKLFLAAGLLLPGLCGNTQRVIDVNKDNVNVGALFYSVGQMPFSPVKYVKVVEGTPYFKEEWMKGAVVMNDSVEYINLRLRLDLLANDLEFIDKNGEPLIATNPVKQVRLVDSVTGKSFLFVHSSSIGADQVAQGWYELLVEGKVSLYKKIQKSVQEYRPYGSALNEQKIVSADQYFLHTGHSLARIKKFKDLPDMLASKRTALSKLASDNKLTGKNQQDYADLVTAYNH